ncbi:MAG: tRNA uridine-5-carboxymethylaminomethyl(34) synthesis GTPase MnmE [Proteobacteria bacterium]|nr:tRNA uridine-5-carboxymethylaminomethyl(34) synthesis GTPase MnmE [Cystobacterineae bacterium]MCL2315133.1 tRNA uridine-5-carboxymethylaminomethyl(34) synthesis GTPase MnmE [Pseudomonadota bacterium]
MEANPTRCAIGGGMQEGMQEGIQGSMQESIQEGAPPLSSTIAAIATGPVRAGIGVIRLSGPSALAAAQSLAPGLVQPKPRHAHFLRFESGGVFLDEGLLLWFPAPASYTGEEVVELQLHGAPLMLARMLRLLCQVPGVREALPGEYAQRAFANGRMDLAQAEAIVALIESKTEAAAQAAAAQMAGHWSTRIGILREALVGLLAQAEACLDFPEETEGVEEALPARLAEVYAQAAALLRLGQQGQLLRSGARLVLFGPANAGKSTLLNALVGFARALVDAEPGTTRDILEVPLEWSGIPLVLVDTAGIREAQASVEARGIEAAKQAVAGADIALLVVPPEACEAQLEVWRALAPPGTLLEVYSKVDLGPAPQGVLAVSAQTGEGMAFLHKALQQRLGGEAAEAIAACSHRQRAALEECCYALESALGAVVGGHPLELTTSHLQVAQAALGQLLGEALAPEVLDEIFRQFCLGK